MDQLNVVYCCAGRLRGHNLLNINTNSLLMMNGAQSPLPSPHAGRVSSPAPLISATPGNFRIIVQHLTQLARTSTPFDI